MQRVEREWAELEDKLIRLGQGHAQLAQLVDQQRRMIRKADPKGLAEVGIRMDALVRELAEVEASRREVCRELAGRVNVKQPESGRIKLESLCERAPGRWPSRLRLAASQLTAQMDKVRRAGRVNLDVARQLGEFCGELLGQMSRLGRDTGCYDARGRKAVAREAIAPSCFSAVA
ncbi:MAG: flagellar export chaperone FlgN [Phycisphaerae bacterium]|nr:flagellar export chaperone FlgN [Phycisphaerae bacterium]